MANEPTKTLKLIKEAMGGGLDLGVYTLAEEIYGQLEALVLDLDQVTGGPLDVDGGTVTADDPVLDLSQVWNAGGVTFTGIKLDVTDTASAAASLLLDLRVGGVSLAAITKAGAVRASDGSESLPGFSFVDDVDTGFIRQASNANILAVVGGDLIAAFSGAGIQLDNAFALRWSATAPGQATDLSLFRDAADILAQRRTTNAQTSRIYGTFTDASNYERIALSVADGVAMQTAGTGTDNIPLPLRGAGTGGVQFEPANGAAALVKVASEVLADVSVDAVTEDLLPAGAFILNVATYVVGTLTNGSLTGYQVGDGTDDDRWGDITGVAIGTSSSWADATDTTREVGASALGITITPVGDTFASGSVRVVVHYIDTTAPTS